MKIFKLKRLKQYKRKYFQQTQKKSEGKKVIKEATIER